MNDLTPKQEKFAQSVASGKSQSEAYRIAYNAENMKDEVIWVKASKLMAEDKVTVRVDEIRKPVVEEARLTLGQHLKDLLKLREKAVKDGAWSAAISAEMGRGKAAGLHIDKIDLHEDKELIINIVRFNGDEIEEHSRTKFRS